MIIFFSRSAEKYVRRGRLDWPEGAMSRDSIKAVLKLHRLQNLIMQHVDHSAGDLIHLVQGLLRYDPSDRLSAREALRHPFFTRDHLRRWWKWKSCPWITIRVIFGQYTVLHYAGLYWFGPLQIQFFGVRLALLGKPLGSSVVNVTKQLIIVNVSIYIIHVQFIILVFLTSI